MKNCNDTIGNRTRYLPTCNAVPQPTAPPRTPRGVVRYGFVVLFSVCTAISERLASRPDRITAIE